VAAVPTGCRTIAEIDRSGFYMVHECESDATGETVAVKSLQDPTVAPPEILARFQRKARLMDDVLTHAHVVRV
jgi:hypothetical protein